MKKISVKNLAEISLFAVLNAILAQISVPLFFTPVPITLSLIAVYSTGILLKPSQALYAEICYLLLGAIGIPVFSGFKGGLGILLGPTGGYIIAYPLVSFITSLAVNRENRKNVGYKIQVFSSMIFSQVLLYLIGTIWLSISYGVEIIAAISLAVIPFIFVDLLKIIFSFALIIPFRERFLNYKKQY